MSGVTPTNNSGAGEPVADPSMEDILASIRRILSEDDAPDPSAAAEPVPETFPETVPETFEPPSVTANDSAASPSPADDSDELVLDETMMVRADPPAASPPPVAKPAAPPPARALPVPPLPAIPPLSSVPGAGLLADETEQAAMASVSQLMRSLSNERQMQVYRGGPTLEDMVLESMRPMLKSWLDQYLPPIVERLVQNEIERVTTRALGG